MNNNNYVNIIEHDREHIDNFMFMIEPKTLIIL